MFKLVFYQGCTKSVTGQVNTPCAVAESKPKSARQICFKSYVVNSTPLTVDFLLNDSVIWNLHNSSSGWIPVWEADYSPVYVLPGFHTPLQGVLTGWTVGHQDMALQGPQYGASMSPPLLFLMGRGMYKPVPNSVFPRQPPSHHPDVFLPIYKSDALDSKLDFYLQLAWKKARDRDLLHKPPCKGTSQQQIIILLQVPLSCTFLTHPSAQSQQIQTWLRTAENKMQLWEKSLVLTGAIWPETITPTLLQRLPAHTTQLPSASPS